MSAVEPPDSHYLSAASGWIDLGLPQEARHELARITPTLRLHPAVLAVEWDLHAHVGDWEAALHVALRLLEVDPSRPEPWIHRAYALHELRRTGEARDALVPALTRFPAVGLIPYNLACYACQMGELDQARAFLRQAITLDGRDTVLARARKDADLIALRPELELL